MLSMEFFFRAIVVCFGLFLIGIGGALAAVGIFGVKL